ncbi:glutathione S-transferase T3-like [Quercus robur]|uniref:glutathione S-transferase T3-like n=1 Tax=Quercus robur TaxID=38942 RepID=UPI002163696D|nr:glutathione S-transferase T3-like [Quercus robur]
MNRWSTIQQCTNKFCGYLSQIDSMNQSGMTKEDKLNKARQQYQTLQGSTFSYEHCWNLLKHSAKWLRTIQEHRPKRGRLETTSSSPTLEPIDLEDEDIPHVPNVLERPPGKKAEKERLKKQKSKEGTSSNMEALLNVMIE